MASHFLEQEEADGMPFCSQIVIMVIRGGGCVWLSQQEVSHVIIKLNYLQFLSWKLSYVHLNN